MGGPWYHEQEFDHAFVDAICDYIQRTMVRMIKSKPELYSVVENRFLWLAIKMCQLTDVDLSLQDIDSILDIMVYDGRLERVGPAVLKDPYNVMDKSIICKDLGYPLSPEDLLEQERIEKEEAEKVVRLVEKGVEKEGDVMDEETEDEYTDSKAKKKRKRGKGKKDKKDKEEEPPPQESVFLMRLSRQYSSQGNYLTQMPCGVCPLITQCYDGGVISPTTCVYMTEWLETDQGHVKTDVVTDPQDIFHRIRSESLQW